MDNIELTKIFDEIKFVPNVDYDGSAYWGEALHLWHKASKSERKKYIETPEEFGFDLDLPYGRDIIDYVSMLYVSDENDFLYQFFNATAALDTNKNILCQLFELIFKSPGKKIDNYLKQVIGIDNLYDLMDEYLDVVHNFYETTNGSIKNLYLKGWVSHEAGEFISNNMSASDFSW